MLRAAMDSAYLGKYEKQNAHRLLAKTASYKNDTFRKNSGGYVRNDLERKA